MQTGDKPGHRAGGLLLLAVVAVLQAAKHLVLATPGRELPSTYLQGDGDEAHCDRKILRLLFTLSETRVSGLRS
jgi:hypothetical protein